MSAHSVDVANQYATLYQATLVQAAQAGESIMGKVLAMARQSLKDRASLTRALAERDHFELSIKLLDSNTRSLCQQYPHALTAAFRQISPVVRDVSSDGHPVSRMALLASVNFDQLELMDSTQVHERVALARSQQSVMLAADAALNELNTYICATLGMNAVQPECNPLRTDVYVRALQNLIGETQVPSLVQMEWLQHMSGALGKELALLYGTLSKQLKDKGVKAAGYAVIRSFAASGRPAAGKTGPASHTSLSAAVSPVGIESRDGEEPVLTLDRLRRLLAGELDTPAVSADVASFAAQFSREFEAGEDPPPVMDFQGTVPAAFEALQEMKQVGRVLERFDKRRQAASAGGAGRTPVRSTSSDLGQALSMEVVALMVENIAHDSRLLEPIKELVKNLEPALLRLALVDPRFFSDKQHPARRLLQEITHRSLAYDGIDALGFSDFLAPLLQSVSLLAEMEIEGAEPFEQVLDELFRVWDEQDHPAQLRQAVLALQHAEKRQLLAEKIASEIKGRPEAVKVPAGVLDFLTGPWSQVLAHVQMEDSTGAADPGQYRELVAALLWSAQPELTRKRVAKLTQLVPKLLGKLREGLHRIDYPSLKTSVFFELLMNLHQQAFRPQHANAEPVKAVSPAPGLPEMSDTWVAPAEARASGFMELTEEVTQPAALETALLEMPVFTPAATVMEVTLPVGSWVEMQVNGAWVRSQLSWASPHGTLFLFTSAYGSTQSMTRRLRDRLLAGGSMRVISEKPLVEGALDAVVQSAMLNSLDVSL